MMTGKKLLFLLLFIPLMSFGQTISRSNGLNPDFTVYVTKNSSAADLVVCLVNRPVFAKGNEGKWFIGNYGSKNVHFASNDLGVDLVIYITDDCRFAGWKNRSKKYLLD